MILPVAITDPAEQVAALLRDRGETVAVAEGSAGGLVSTALLAVVGASAYYRGGVVVYTPAAYRAWVAGVVAPPPGMRGATEGFAAHLAESVRVRLDATWGVSEAGAAGPANPYGDPAGHSWLAVSGPVSASRHLLTGVDDRPQNMVAFAAAALELLADALGQADEIVRG
ncbi:MAG: hypothetical protein RI958_2513 [Actinomycetota bacterium]